MGSIEIGAEMPFRPLVSDDHSGMAAYVDPKKVEHSGNLTFGG